MAPTFLALPLPPWHTRTDVEIAGLRRKKPVKPKPKDCGRFVRFYRSLETGREENSSGEATTSRNSEINQHIEYDLVFVRQLQAMDNLTIDTPADEDDDISCVPSPSDSETDEPAEGNNEEVII
uniref:Uncharacterized protein n=1 Tax=Oryza glumipatula TaxID=40148 RepID=A0A0E0B965_9ORYZ